MPERHGSLTADGRSGAKEKVLVVVDGFPATGGSRIDKFVKFLPEFGFEPFVLSAKETDSARAQELKRRFYPPELRTYHAGSVGWSYFSERFLMRGPGAKHYRLLGLLSFPERCVLVPDYMVRWVPLGIRLAKAIVQREGIRVVLTSSPPESTHLIGMNLKQALGLRWVADFRDLWTEKKLLYRPPTRFHDWWVRRLEKKTFETADCVIANTPENAQRYVQRFALPAERLQIIPNGFDRDDLVMQGKAQRAGDVFRLGYAGALDKHDFPWRIALAALKKLALGVGRAKVKLVHCGYLSDQVRVYLQAQQIEDLVEIHGNLPHADAMNLTANTEVRLLLLYENAYSSAIVPMKLYNYLIMDGPILAVAPENGMTASIIAETRMGSVISPSRGVDAVHRQLLAYYQTWSRGELTVDPDQERISFYDRRTQAMRLSDILRVH